MNEYIRVTQKYVVDHKKIFSIGTVAFIAAIALICIAMVALYTNISDYAYQPVKACDLLTPAKAQDLLGNKVIGVDANDPTVTGNTATSKCSYSDTNTANMMVAAVAVRSGLNDEGIRQNKTDFTAHMPTENIETVKGLGNSAYFDKTLGQLNILNGREWLILSYGVGATPEANTLDNATALAHKVLQ